MRAFNDNALQTRIKFINRLKRAIAINTLLNYLVRSVLENVGVMFLFSGFMVLVCGSVHKPDNIEDEPSWLCYYKLIIY